MGKIIEQLHSKLVVDVSGLLGRFKQPDEDMEINVSSNSGHKLALNKRDPTIAGFVYALGIIALIFLVVSWAQILTTVIQPIVVLVVIAYRAHYHNVHSNHRAVVVGNGVAGVGSAPLKRANHINIVKVYQRPADFVVVFVFKNHLGVTWGHLYAVLVQIGVAVTERFVTFIVIVAEISGIMKTVTIKNRTVPFRSRLSDISTLHSKALYHTRVFNTMGGA